MCQKRKLYITNCDVKHKLRYKSRRSCPSSEFRHVRDYSRLAYEDLSLDLKFVASSCASGVQSDTVSRMCHTLHGLGKRDRGKKREKEESCGCSCDTAVAYREKLPYHANLGTSPKHLRFSAMATSTGGWHVRIKVDRA